jgi:hypothetical protein
MTQGDGCSADQVCDLVGVPVCAGDTVDSERHTYIHEIYNAVGKTDMKEANT